MFVTTVLNNPHNKVKKDTIQSITSCTVGITCPILINLGIIDPKQKANSIIDSLPGNSLVSKTGYITLGTGLATFLISKEVYVFNEETLVLVGAGGLLFGLLKYLREPFTTMGNEHINVGLHRTLDMDE